MSTQTCPSCGAQVMNSQVCCNQCGWQFAAPTFAGGQGISPVGTPAIVQGLSRPRWTQLCSRTVQMCVMVRDASGSMCGEKARAADDAGYELIQELAAPGNKDHFHVAVVDFDDDAQILASVTKATALAGGMKKLSPGGATNITDGLEKAAELVSGFVAPDGLTPLRPIVLLFSDGEHNVGDGPDEVAKRLKSKADLVTVAFGEDADETLLKRIATSPQHFYRCKSGAQLRQFFATVGKTMTKSMARGQNTAQALAQIQ